MVPAISRYECIIRHVKIIKHALVKRESGPQDGCKYRLFFQYIYSGNA